MSWPNYDAIFRQQQMMQQQQQQQQHPLPMMQPQQQQQQQPLPMRAGQLYANGNQAQLNVPYPPQRTAFYQQPQYSTNGTAYTPNFAPPFSMSMNVYCPEGAGLNAGLAQTAQWNSSGRLGRFMDDATTNPFLSQLIPPPPGASFATVQAYNSLVEWQRYYRQVLDDEANPMRHEPPQQTIQPQLQQPVMQSQHQSYNQWQPMQPQHEYQHIPQVHGHADVWRRTNSGQLATVPTTAETISPQIVGSHSTVTAFPQVSMEEQNNNEDIAGSEFLANSIDEVSTPFMKWFDNDDDIEVFSLSKMTASDSSDFEVELNPNGPLVAPTPYAHLPLSPLVPQNSSLIRPQDSRFSPLFVAPSNKPLDSSEASEMQLQQASVDALLAGMDPSEKNDGRRIGMGKEEKPKRLPRDSANASVAQRMDPVIFRFPAKKGGDVELDLHRVMAGYTHDSNGASKRAIKKYVLFVLHKAHQDGLAALKVTVDGGKRHAYKGNKMLSKENIRVLSEFWVNNFNSANSSAEDVEDYVEQCVKCYLQNVRSVLKKSGEMA